MPLRSGIERWSDEATKTFGWTAKEAVGKRIDELKWIYPEDRPVVEAVMADMLSGKRAQREQEPKRSQGRLGHRVRVVQFHALGSIGQILCLVPRCRRDRGHPLRYRTAQDGRVPSGKGPAGGRKPGASASRSLEWLCSVRGFTALLGRWLRRTPRETSDHRDDRTRRGRGCGESAALAQLPIGSVVAFAFRIG